jgi:hypothetical protein
MIGIPLISCRDGVCFNCVLGKHHQDSFDKCSFWHSLAPLQLVHCDFCVMSPSTSLSGFKYFLTFIVDFSRCTWVYLLKLKINVFDMILSYEALT